MRGFYVVMLIAATPVNAETMLSERAIALCSSTLDVPAAELTAIGSIEGRFHESDATVYTFNVVHAETANGCSIVLDAAGQIVDEEALATAEANLRRDRYGAMTRQTFDYVAGLPNAPVTTTIWIDRPADTPNFRTQTDPLAAKKEFTEAAIAPILDRLSEVYPDSRPRQLGASFAAQADLLPPEVREVSRWVGVSEVVVNGVGELLSPVWFETHDFPLARMVFSKEGFGATAGIIEFGKWSQVATVPRSGAMNVLVDGYDGTTIPVQHLVGVASIISNSQSAVEPGASPSASLRYAGIADGYNVPGSATDAANLLIAQQAASINISFHIGIPVSGRTESMPWKTPEVFGRACDEHAYDLGTTFVAGAGNTGNYGGDWEYVVSPANGLNVIAVGMFSDSGSPDHADDKISPRSNWKNPPGVYGDRAKPDVVASADSLDVVCSNCSLGFRSSWGTSYASPIVAGIVNSIAAESKASGRGKVPVEINRAILAASSILNVDGVVSGNQTIHASELDGAGGVNAFLAGSIVSNPSRYGLFPYFNVSSTNGCFPPQQRQAIPGSRRTLAAGQRVRAAIAWSSLASPLGMPTADVNLLVVRVDPVSGASLGLAGWSISAESTFEAVEFTVSQPGTYELVVSTRYCTAGPEHGIGWAWFVP